MHISIAVFSVEFGKSEERLNCFSDCWQYDGLGCSKLSMSLVHVWLKFQILISEIRQYFCGQNEKSFSHFSAKTISVF